MKKVVYWIRHVDHTDPATQGYIGVSIEVKARWKAHIKSLSSPQLDSHLIRSMKLYGSSIVFGIIHEYDSIEEALLREIELRPCENIGWNMCAGGGYPARVTKQTAAKISESIKKLKMCPYSEKTSHNGGMILLV